MSNIESSALQTHTTAANVAVSAARGTTGTTGTMVSKARIARGFLIHLISREIQLSGYAASWLRATSQRLADQHFAELSADCVLLATQTWELREQLIALAHRLVARRNRGLSHRRINVMQLLEEPPSAGMRAFIEFNQDIIENAAPGVELAVVSAIEQLLVGVVPLAIDLAGFDDAANDDLAEVAEVYAARFARVEALRQLTAALLAAVPECREALRDASDRAIDSYTQIIRESAEAGLALAGTGMALAGTGEGLAEHLDDRRGSMC
jgi:hypothetical protein